MAALLDALKIKQVIVIGTSGGGPTALQFALRHPDRTQALVMFTAISGQHIQPGRTLQSYGWFLFSKYAAWILDMGWWIINGMVQRFPRMMIRSMFKATTTDEFKIREEVDYVMSHPEALACIGDLMQTQIPLSVRKAGLDNDIEAGAHLPVYPVDQITCPTLVVHGRLDGNVPFSHGEFVANNVPGAQMHRVDEGGHLVCAGSEAEQIQSVVIQFLKKDR
jgi:pimeloyl-ACP methyl ester carboxylesterase